MRALISIILLFLFAGIVNGQTPTREEIDERMTNQLEIYPQEKVHLHVDRDYFVPGEKIWFKAYLVDAYSHLYPSRSRYVYVELISPADTLISRVMLRPAEGLHYGHIFLSDVIPEGTYTLRAYTRYMENLGEEYFFKKHIHIGNLALNADESDKNTRRKRKASAPKEDFDVTFYPEGGNLLEGTLCRIAFKALNRSGLPENITGEIVDEEGIEWASVRTLHAGMGMFSIIPSGDKTYYLMCRDNKGKSKKIKLPKAVPNVYSLLSYWRKNNLYITCLKSADTGDAPTYLLAHSRGLVLYFGPWNTEKTYLSFAGEELPTGVIQLVLFDGQMNPVSERLVFNKNIETELANLEFRTDKDRYETREHLSSYLKVTDENGLSLLANLSVSVTDDKDVEVSSESILSTFLLTSELRGTIESPGYYFEGNDEKRTVELDLLMMTHGWRRYNIPEVIKGNAEEPRRSFEESQAISGVIKSLFLSRPVRNSEITIMTSEGDFAQLDADENGRFLFTGYEYPDSTTYFVQSLGKKGSDRVDLILDKEEYPVVKHLPYKQPSFEVIAVADTTSATPNSFMEKAEQRAKYNEDMRVVHLKNVDVVAQAKKREIEDVPWFARNADNTIDRKAIEQRNPLFVTDLLYMIPGVRVSSNGIVTIRGQNSIMGYLPLVLIDGMPIEWPGEMFSRYESPLEMVPVQDIERIDVLKGASAAMFGVRGSGGVIGITTRRGVGLEREDIPFNRIVLNPLGYQKPVEFYSPKYDTPELRYTGQPDYRTTIFWKPDIITDENGEATFDFYTSDFATSYSVVIEGITDDGKLIRKVEKIRVE